MSEILDHIHQDHRNMVSLLDLLEQELRELAAGDDHDYALMANIVDYFNHYPAHHHHPFEDKIFEWLAKERPTLQAEVDKLRDQHDTQAKSVARLAMLIQGVQMGHMVPRAQIVELTKNFIETQREHIQTEEGHILKEAEGILSGFHLKEIPIPNRSNLDPLFGDELDQNFACAAAALGRDVESADAAASKKG